MLHVNDEAKVEEATDRLLKAYGIAESAASPKLIKGIVRANETVKF